MMTWKILMTTMFSKKIDAVMESEIKRREATSASLFFLLQTAINSAPVETFR